MQLLRDCLADYQNSVRGTERLLELILQFREFGSASPSSETLASWAEAHSLLEKAGDVRTDLPVVSGSLYLYAAGRFEHFARTLVEGIASHHCSNAARFEDLPTALQNAFRLNVLQISTSPKKFNYSPEESHFLLETWVKVVSHERDPSTLDCAAVSLTDSNLRPDALADILKRVDIDKFWPAVSSEARLQLCLEVNNQSDCQVQAKSRLNQIMETRNSIAHPSSSTSFPSPETVKQDLSFLERLAEVTIDVVQVRLQTSK